MATSRFWMIGCIGFAALSAYLAINNATMGFGQYANTVHHGFVLSQRYAMFKLISELRPALQVDQVEAAAKAARLSIARRPGSLHMIGGVEFIISGTEISGARSTNF
jgi:hypothetical protein